MVETTAAAGSVGGEAPKREAVEEARPTLGRLDTMLLAFWIGSGVGLVEAALKTANNLRTERIVRLSWHYPWMMPVVLAVLLGAVGLLLAIVRRRGHVDARVPLFALGFLGAFEAALWLPKLHIAATAMLAAGLASVLMRVASAQWGLFRRVMQTTVPVLALVVVGLIGWCFGMPWWRERQALAAMPAALRGAPNVVLLVLDTVRGDHMGIHGYERPTTPELEAWARRRGGYVFDSAYSSSPWSLPGHAVMFTGRWRHELDLGWEKALAESERTVAEHLREGGYDTGGFVANLAYCLETTGLGQGFSRYADWPLDVRTALTTTEVGQKLYKWAEPTFWEAMTRLWPRPPVWYRTRTGDGVNGEALAWLDGRPTKDRPFFLFLNYFDAHAPYVTPPWYERRYGKSARKGSDFGKFVPGHAYPPKDPEILQRLIDAYDDGIAYADEAFGRLMAGLESRGLVDNTWVIVTSDHGELLGEHGLFSHSKSLYEPVLRVPLVMIPPRGQRGAGDEEFRRIAAAVGLRDLPATIAGLAWPNAEPAFPGRSMERWFADESAGESDPILAELGSLDADDRAVGGIVKRYAYLRGLIHGSAKLIDRFLDPEYQEMYDVAADPAEERELSGVEEEGRRREELQRVLEGFYDAGERSRLKKMEG